MLAEDVFRFHLIQRVLIITKHFQFGELVKGNLRVNFKDFPDTALVQYLIAFLMHSERQFVDLTMHRVESFGVSKYSVNILLKHLWLR